MRNDQERFDQACPLLTGIVAYRDLEDRERIEPARVAGLPMLRARQSAPPPPQRIRDGFAF